MLLGAHYEDSDSRSSISSSMVVERILRFLGNESAAYVISDDGTRYFFSNLDGFWTGSEALDLVTCPIFWVGHWIRHKDCTLAPTFEGGHWERRRGRI